MKAARLEIWRDESPEGERGQEKEAGTAVGSLATGFPVLIGPEFKNERGQKLESGPGRSGRSLKVAKRKARIVDPVWITREIGSPGRGVKG